MPTQANPKSRLRHLKNALLLAVGFGLMACDAPPREASESRKVADAFMMALTMGDTDQAKALTVDTPTSQDAVVYLTKAVRMKAGEAGVKAFDFKFVSEMRPQSTTSPARVVYSQKINNEIPQENIVVELSWDKSDKRWKVSNLILR